MLATKAPLMYQYRVGVKDDKSRVMTAWIQVFWAKAEELGVMIFMHPQPAAGTTQNPRLQGKGGLGNTIGNPLETTVFLSHLIFEGTLDRFPGLKICAAHAGGLPHETDRQAYTLTAEMIRVLVSSCLLGEPVRYHGGELASA